MIDRTRYFKDWRKKNRKRLAEYTLKRRRDNKNFGLAAKLNKMVANAIKLNCKHSIAQDILGCSIQEAKTYLESKFLPRMSWENWSRTGWHVDHIKPCHLFDLTNEEEQKKCFHYTNLQPLWAKDNLKHAQYSNPVEKEKLTNLPRNKIVAMSINANLELPSFMAKEIEIRLKDKRVGGTKKWLITQQ